MTINNISSAFTRPAFNTQSQPTERASNHTCPHFMAESTGPQNGPNQDIFTLLSNLFSAPQESKAAASNSCGTKASDSRKAEGQKACSTEAPKAQKADAPNACGAENANARRAEAPPTNTQQANPFIIIIIPTGGCNAGGMNPPAGIGNDDDLSGQFDEQQLLEAAGGNRQIMETLKKIAKDPEGAKALQAALDNGATFKQGELEGNTVGLTEFNPDGPVITLEDPSDVDTAAHELAHAADPNMPHDEVYEFGHQVARNLGERENKFATAF